ncbi:three-Cys-motif partner protein TcmP [Leptolyngbya sp. GGD]|uniref:three-Cys-motif partner protein TcmP n=1 Tax=Leptolyngbya sp. GGD TaxID=2997907 RepID=UPI00227CEFA6|nr:three-Cys-motif partner protein TcmP [Leptolyngbya sp. GGD]MCY6490763.1 three-Cys-motif partner protein TcmP [Leptolyngbya sp. GGD]
MSNIQLDLFSQNSESSQEFFTRKRSWSAAKHRIMLRYIQSYCYNLGGEKASQSKHLNYVDGFAGEGSYDEGIGIEDFVNESNFWKRYDINLLDTDGSPLIALKCAKGFRAEERVNLRCLFAEANKRTNQKLRENCSAHATDLDLKIYDPQPFSHTFPQILQDLNGYPTVFFLDAFGVKGLSFEQICSIGDYVSKAKGELFLLFHNVAVARHAGFLTTKSDNERMKRTAETYMRNLTTLLGPNSDQEWKPQWEELKDQSQEFERWALHYFVHRISRESQFKGVATYEIKERYNDTRPMYSIVACSNHPWKAFGYFLNDFFVDEDRFLFYEEDKSKRNRNFLEQKWNQQVHQRKVDAKPEIIKILNQTNRQWKKLDDVITDVILALSTKGFGLGFLKRSDYRIIMLELFKERIIQADSLGRNNVPKLESKVRIVQ